MRPRTSDNRQTNRARADPRSALVKTHRLIRDGKSDAAERVLVKIIEEHGDTTAAATADAVRRLCSASAEHRRLADELEAAAQRHRLAEQELRHGIDALFASWGLEIEASRAHELGPPTEAGPGRFRRLFTRYSATPARPLLPPSNARFAAAPDLVLGTGLSRPPPLQPDPDADVSVRVLGPFDVTVACQRIARWPSLKARSLLQYLVLHPDRPVRRELLMELFWPRHSHESGRNNLNVSLYSLRQTLQQQDQARHVVLYQNGCYFLNPGLRWWIDQVEFLGALRDAHDAGRATRPDDAIHAYLRAVDLYRGPLFEDSTCEWHFTEQRHLEEIYLQVLEQLGELFLNLGDLANAAQAAERALTTDRCRESAHRLLMRCYAGQHQQHLVSRQLQLCVTTLREELGVTASALTFRLFEELTKDG